jgi:hypothetical protein
MNRYKEIAAATYALLLLAACGSSGNGGGIGDILVSRTPSSKTYDIRGTIDSVDQNSRSIVLANVSGYNASLNPSGGSSRSIYYDDRTTIDYQGRTYRPNDLERGDEVSVRVNDSRNHLVAETMSVTNNSRGGMASSTTGTYGNGTVVHGTVRPFDSVEERVPHRRSISIDRGSGSFLTVEYTASTPVSFNGGSYAPNDLEPGDEIDVSTKDLGSGRVGALRITVTHAINGRLRSSSTTLSTIQGTVRSVDSANLTIELDGFHSSPKFQTNSGTPILVHYDSNVSVDYKGQVFPVTNLERGDFVEVQVQSMEWPNYLAQRILLVRNMHER